MKIQKISKPPLISIIIPIYNASLFLYNTVESALIQDYPNLEILLINDGSTDNSKQVCNSLITKYQNTQLKNPQTKNRHFRFIDLPHQGVSNARNRGLKEFSGTYFCFLDADDLLTPTFISELYHFAIKYQLKYVSSTYQRHIFSPNKTVSLLDQSNHKKSQQPPHKIFSSSDYLYQLLNLENGYSFCHMKLIHRSLKTTLFDPSLKVAEDALYNFTIIKNLNKVGILQKPLYIYQVHQNSTVRSYTNEYIENYRIALQKISTYLHIQYPDQFPQLEKPLQAFIATHLFFILANFCCHGQNPHPQKSIRSLYKITLFYRAIYLAPLRFFSLSKALVLLCFKLRFVLLLQLMGRFRSKQNRSTNSKQ